jgi:hypothetical protein
MASYESSGVDEQQVYAQLLRAGRLCALLNEQLKRRGGGNRKPTDMTGDVESEMGELLKLASRVAQADRRSRAFSSAARIEGQVARAFWDSLKARYGCSIAILIGRGWFILSDAGGRTWEYCDDTDEFVRKFAGVWMGTIRGLLKARRRLIRDMRRALKEWPELLAAVDARRSTTDHCLMAADVTLKRRRTQVWVTLAKKAIHIELFQPIGSFILEENDLSGTLHYVAPVILSAGIIVEQNGDISIPPPRVHQKANSWPYMHPYTSIITEGPHPALRTK